MFNLKFMIGARVVDGKQRVVFMRPVPLEISVEDALELAASIVAMFDTHDAVAGMAEAIRSQ